MKWLILLVTLASTSCLRHSTDCATDGDCFAGEQCSDGVCQAPVVVVGGVPAPASAVTPAENGQSYAMVLDERDEPHFFILTDVGAIEHWRWDGFAWSSSAVATALDIDEIGTIEATYDESVGYVVVVSLDGSLVAFESRDAGMFERVELVDETVFATSLDANNGIVAACAFRGDLSDIDTLTPFVLIRDKGGDWATFDFDEPATPFCGVALSPRGVLTVAFSRYDDDVGEEIYLAQTIASPAAVVDLTLTNTRVLGRVVSGHSLDVTTGDAVLMHADRGIGTEDLYVTRFPELDRSITRFVGSIPVARFYSSADIYLDPLDPRRAAIATLHFTVSAADPAGQLGELVGDYLALEPSEELAGEASMVFEFGTDGVMRVGAHTSADGLTYRVGL